jgi:hypothetical protein
VTSEAKYWVERARQAQTRAGCEFAGALAMEAGAYKEMESILYRLDVKEFGEEAARAKWEEITGDPPL